MARKTNLEIQNMTISDAKYYAKKHPAESGRISKELAKAAADCAGVYVIYATKNVYPAQPSAVTVSL